MKTKKIQNDFFTAFRLQKLQHIRMYMFAIFVAIFGAFLFNVMIRGDIDTRKISASVAQLYQKNDEYMADIVIRNNGNSFEIVFGSYAQSIDAIEGILVGDPKQLASIRSQQDTLTLTPLSGMYQFHIDMKGATVRKGAIIARFTADNIETNTLSLADTQFISHGTRYNISNIVE